MTKDIEIGTRYHTMCERAFHREEIRRRVAFFVWFVLLFSLPFLNMPGLIIGGVVILALLFLMLIAHWSREAVHYRVHKRISL